MKVGKILKSFIDETSFSILYISDVSGERWFIGVQITNRLHKTKGNEADTQGWSIQLLLPIHYLHPDALRISWGEG